MNCGKCEKVLVVLRGVYNLPFNLDDPVVTNIFSREKNISDTKVFYDIVRSIRAIRKKIIIALMTLV